MVYLLEKDMTPSLKSSHLGFVFKPKKNVCLCVQFRHRLLWGRGGSVPACLLTPLGDNGQALIGMQSAPSGAELPLCDLCTFAWNQVHWP